MATFHDSQGRGWTVVLTYYEYRQIRLELELNLLDLLVKDQSGWLLNQLYGIGDCTAIADCLTVVCRSQAAARGIDDDDFRRLLTGDVLSQAIPIFRQQLVDFISDLDVRAAIQAQMETVAQQVAKIAKTIREDSPQLPQQMPQSGKRQAKSA